MTVVGSRQRRPKNSSKGPACFLPFLIFLWIQLAFVPQFKEFIFTQEQVKWFDHNSKKTENPNYKGQPDPEPKKKKQAGQKKDPKKANKAKKTPTRREEMKNEL